MHRCHVSRRDDSRAKSVLMIAGRRGCCPHESTATSHRHARPPDARPTSATGRRMAFATERESP
eukprot:6463000-Prymnesium_polylepis.1